MPKDKAESEDSTMKLSHCWSVSLFYLAGAAFLYLQLFILPSRPIFLPNDSLIWLQDARAMVEGKVLYRDVFQITFPGIQVVLAALIKAFGARVWLPNAILVLLGTLAAWLTTLISKRVIGGPSALLPAFLLISFEFSAWHVVTHHWFSTLAAMAAILVILEKRSVGRIGAAGALCGLSAWFTQTEGSLVLVGFAVFVLWECRRQSRGWRPLVVKWGLLFGGFVLVVGLGVGYFVWKAGPREFLWSTFVFPVKYAPSWVDVNTYRVYFGSFWDSVPGRLRPCFLSMPPFLGSTSSFSWPIHGNATATPPSRGIGSWWSTLQGCACSSRWRLRRLGFACVRSLRLPG